MTKLKGRPFLSFKWLDFPGAGNLVYNQEGKHQTIATPGEMVRTQLVTEEALSRFIREGKAELR